MHDVGLFEILTFRNMKNDEYSLYYTVEKYIIKKKHSSYDLIILYDDVLFVSRILIKKNEFKNNKVHGLCVQTKR